jgi:ABC-type Fe3+ transport system substrate-binding protein
LFLKNAARLFNDFILSKEGQEMLRGMATQQVTERRARYTVPLRAPTFHENPTLAGSAISIVFLDILSLDEGTNGGAVEIKHS